MKTKKQQMTVMGTGRGFSTLEFKGFQLFKAGLVTLGESGLTLNKIKKIERARRAFVASVKRAVHAGAGVHPARKWSRGGAWDAVAIRRGARGGFDLGAPERRAWDYPAAAAPWWAGAGACGCKAAARVAEELRAARIDSAAPVLRRARRFDDLCEAFGVVPLGTLGARARRARRVSAGAGLSGAAVRYFSAPAPVYQLGAPVVQNGRVVWARGERTGLFDCALMTLAAQVAEARARKWVRGTHSSGKGAAGAEEVGAAAGADDLADYFVRLEREALGIFRAAALVGISRLLDRADRWGVLVDWSDLRKLAALRSLGRAGRRRAEAWEYAACRARDGREVGGGWALQGAIHGLKDFWLESSTPAAAGDSNPDDFCAAEWSNQLDMAAARLGFDVEENSRAGAGSSPEWAEALAEAGAVASLGALAWSPTAGAGSGVRPSIAAALSGAVDQIRESVARRVSKATTPQAAAAARVAGAAEVDLVAALVNWRNGGDGPSADVLAEFFAGGDLSAKLSSTGRSKLKRLRDRAGISAPCGPAGAVESRRASQILR